MADKKKAPAATEADSKKTSLYDNMVIDLGEFVCRTAQKDSPIPAELVAMVEITKILFRTV